MKLTDLGRLTALIARLARTPLPSSVGDPRVDERPGGRTPAGDVEYDLYLPRDERRATVVALHGVLLEGRRDPRLIHFGRSLARSGIACYIPTLPGLRACRWEPRDIDAALAASTAAASAAGGRVGLVGFCFGASYALLAAARPALAPRVSFVLAFGPYHDLGELFDGYAELARREREAVRSDDDWDNWIYLHLVLARQLAERGQLAAELGAEVDALLARYCHSASPAEKRAFFEERLRPLALPERSRAHRDQAALEALSPRGKLGALEAAVSLVHDPRDIIVPARHSERIFAELPPGRRPGRHNLLVTTLVSHAQLADVLRPRELWRFLGALGPILSAYDS